MRNLLDPVRICVAAGDCNQLQIVDHDHVEPDRALQASGASGQLADRDTACIVDIERQVLKLFGRFTQSFKVALVEIALTNPVGSDASPLGDDPCCELFVRHFQREEADNCAVYSLLRAVILHFCAIGRCGIVGNVGCKRGFPH